MNRKEFLKEGCRCSFVAQKDDEVERLNRQIDFSRERFTDLIVNLRKYLDEDKRRQLYVNTGENCASSYEEAILPFRGNLKSFIIEQQKQKWLSGYELDEEKKELRLIGAPRTNCGCTLVRKGLTPTEFCYCSTGHIKKLYEIVTGSNVEVELQSSFLMGEDHCSFLIRYS